MQLVAVKLYPAADEDGCGNRAYAYAAHSTEVHKGNCQTDSNECAVKAVFDDAEFNFADEGDNQDDALTGGNKNFSADAEKNAEGKDDGAKDAVKPLPEQCVRFYPATGSSKNLCSSRRRAVLPAGPTAHASKFAAAEWAGR